ncbi:hypothetical protein [uncultured Zobellia sp.]|uniref:hypothetical protein n=1 Tax=uncultured Zobellia sp. TaxID=255433 RepID=UPI002592FDB7|nr:hypothetical protein [uncultured Zobellia sp.]
MKFQYYAVAILLLFIACDKTKDVPVPANESLIAGKWKQTEAYISDAGPHYWVTIENGEEISFSDDGSFTSNRFPDCNGGIYSIEEGTLLLNYDCDELDAELFNTEGFVTYNLEFYKSYFLLTPTSGPICIEGCSYKYQSQ